MPEGAATQMVYDSSLRMRQQKYRWQEYVCMTTVNQANPLTPTIHRGS